MGRIDELIRRYCPNGVEYVFVKDIAKCSMGEFVHKSKQDPSFPYPVYNGGTTNTGYYKDYNSNENKVIVSARGAGAGFVNLIEQKFWAGNSCHILSVLDANRTNYKYLFYSLKKIEQELIGGQQKGGIPAVSKTQLETTVLPLPPLPVQEEIVRVLDTFTNLAAELQAELQARQQQYNYYRDKLLTNFTPEQQVKEYTLGELGTFKRGNGLQKKDFTETGIGCIHYGQIYTKFGAFTDKTLTYVDETLASRLLQVEKGNLVIACTSENVEDICKCVAWLGEDNICTGGHACVFRHKQNPKYIAYFFQTEYFFNQKVKYTYGTKVKDIKPDSIAKIKIPLPSLKEQERIVSILDNLYTLTNDLTIGLPAEIEARRQQYEYYRDQLLTFKRKA